MKQRSRLYLAGPDVFLPDAVEIGRRKKALCEAQGFEGLFPLDNEIAVNSGATGTAQSADRLIYRANVAMMRSADAGIFNLTPFRGPSADVGTVFELGLMCGLSKSIFGYTNCADDLRGRVAGARRLPDGTWVGEDGLVVEDFGNADNLMIDAALADAGNALIRHEAGGRLDGLGGFEAALRLAARRMGTT